MKKILVFIILSSIVFWGTLPAQGIGIKGGLNLGKFTGDDVNDIADELDEKYQMGYSAGAFISIPFGELFSLRPEVLFTNNGAKYESSQEGAELKMVMSMNWLNVPVLAVVNLGPVKVFAGPYFDLFLSGKTKIEATYGGETFDEEEDIDKEEISSFVYGAVAGAALGIGNMMDIELRYSQGLSTLDKEPDDWDASYGDYEKSDFKPSMIQVLLNIYLAQ